MNMNMNDQYSLSFLLILYFSATYLASWGGIAVCFLYSIENYPSPEVKPLNYIAYPNIYLKATSAFRQNKSPLVYVFVIDPFLLRTPAITP